MKRLMVFALVLVFLSAPVAMADENTAAGAYLLSLINEARANPLAMIARLHLSSKAARSALGADAWILDQGLPPLDRNAVLDTTAQAHNVDMVSRLYYAYDTPEGVTVSQRIAAAGYKALATGETLGVLAFKDYMDPYEAAAYIFINMFTDELSPTPSQPREILSPDVTEIGISFTANHINLGDNLPPNIYLAVLDFARPVSGPSYLVGQVYYNTDNDSLFSPAEAATGVHLVITDTMRKTSQELVIDNTGVFQLPLKSGVYIVDALGPDGQLLAERYLFQTSNSNQWMDLSLSGN